MSFVLLALSKDAIIYIQLGERNNVEKTFMSKEHNNQNPGALTTAQPHPY